MKLYRMFFLVGFFMLLPGCATTIKVLPESDIQYKIPANTPFSVQMIDKGPITQVQRPTDSWNIEAGNLSKLQEQADACTLKGK